MPITTKGFSDLNQSMSSSVREWQGHVRERNKSHVLNLNTRQKENLPSQRILRIRVKTDNLLSLKMTQDRRQVYKLCLTKAMDFLAEHVKFVREWQEHVSARGECPVSRRNLIFSRTPTTPGCATFNLSSTPNWILISLLEKLDSKI